MNLIIKLLTNRSNSIVSGALIVAFFGFLSRIVGLLRDRILASKFGAGDELDIYYAAFRIPDLIFNILIIGAISAAFIPVFLYYLNISKQEADKFLNAVFGFILILLVFVSVIFIIFAPYIMKLVVPGFEAEKMKLVVLLTRIMFLSPIFLGLSTIFGSVLQALKHFLIFSLAPIFYNLGIILGAIVLVNYFGISGLAIGVVLGAFLHLIIQMPSIYFFGFKPKLSFDFFHPGIFKILKLTLPRIIGLAASQINLWVITAIASTFIAGSLAIFNLANNLQYVPVGVIGIPFAIAAYPILVDNFIKNEKEKAISNTSLVIRQILFYIIPISIMFIVLRSQIVRIILGVGKFDWEATRLTAAALALFSLSIFAQSLIALLARVFYSMQNTKTPMFISIFSVIINIILSFAFVIILEKSQFIKENFAFLLRVEGLDDIRILTLPLAFSLASIINFVLLFIFLRKELGYLDEKRIIKAFLKIFFAALVGGFVAYLSLNFASKFVNMRTFIGIFLQAFFATICAVVSFFGICILLSCEEFYIFKNAIVWQISKIRNILSKSNLSELIEQ